VVVHARWAWSVERRRETVADLHRPWPDPKDVRHRCLAVCRVVGAGTLVLGSTQGRAAGDERVRTGPRTVRRRGGGGAVYLAPGQQVWIDLWIPRDDPLWDDDVVASAGWVGDAWAAALRDLGVASPEVHRGRSRGDETADWVCFAGLGPGEVVVGQPQRKVMGLSQHRSRSGARMQTLAYRWWDPDPVVAGLEELGLLPAEPADVLRVAAARAVGLQQIGVWPVGATDPAQLEAAILARIVAS